MRVPQGRSRRHIDWPICRAILGPPSRNGHAYPLGGLPDIRVVLDNLSTHTPAALYQAFPAAEARRILRRLEFHSTPKHASWLNMVEIEI